LIQRKHLTDSPPAETEKNGRLASTNPLAAGKDLPGALLRRNLRNPLSALAFQDADLATPSRKAIHRASQWIGRQLTAQGGDGRDVVSSDLRRRGEEILCCESSWKVAVNPRAVVKLQGALPQIVAKGAQARPVPGYHCRQRLCPKCQAIRARKWAERTAPLLTEVRDAGRVPKFITLTQPSKVGEPLAQARERMESAWRRFSRSSAWRSRCAAWMVSREVTWSKGAWHYHLHSIVDCGYWPQADLAAAWGQYAAGAKIVDIREAKAGTEQEIVKYALKTLSVPPGKLLELIEAMHAKRTVSCGGAWHNRVKPEDCEPSDELPAGWEFIDVVALRDAQLRGEHWAHLAMAACMRWLEERHAEALARFTGALLHPDDGRRLRALRDRLPDASSVDWIFERDGRAPEAVS
jgi:hypothetical protein